MRQAVRVGRQHTLATGCFKGRNPNSKCGSGMRHKPLVENALPTRTCRSRRPCPRDVRFEGSAIIPAGGLTHPLLQTKPDRGRTGWILILCAWTLVALLFTVQRIAVVKLRGTHVNWVEGVPELVYWYVWAVYTPLVIVLAKRFQLTGPRIVSHVAAHTIGSFMLAPLVSVTEYFVSRGLVRSVFRIADPGALPPFAVSVLAMSFTGVLTY